PHRSTVLLSRGKGCHWTHDGRGRDSALIDAGRSRMKRFRVASAGKAFNRKGRRRVSQAAETGLQRTVVLVAVAGLWLVTCSLAYAVSEPQIDQIFAELRSVRSPGAAVLVLKNGNVVFERGYGVADLRSFRKIDAHTNFRL